MAHDPLELSIVVLNYRTSDLVIACLESLVSEVANGDARVVVVDNGSGDGSDARIRAWIDTQGHAATMQVVVSDTNRGFSGGNNFGIAAQKANNYLLLNSDTIVRPGAIEALLAAARIHPEAGLIGPRLEWPDGTPQESSFRQFSPISELLSAARTGPITALFGSYVVPLPVSDTETRSDWTSFACVLIRAEVLAEIGLLDEGFFMYFEDAEFGYRARRAGWEIVNHPKARIVHLHGGTSQIGSLAREAKRMPRYYYESRSRYFRLVHGRAVLLAANLLWYAGRAISVLREFLERRPTHVPAHQWEDIWIGWFGEQRENS